MGLASLGGCRLEPIACCRSLCFKNMLSFMLLLVVTLAFDRLLGSMDLFWLS